MNRPEIILAVQETFRKVLDLETLELAEATSAADVEEWDSLSHIQIVVALEKRFGVKFSSEEILAWERVGDIVSSIEKRL
jgi:acyl carrier protein